MAGNKVYTVLQGKRKNRPSEGKAEERADDSNLNEW